MILNEIDGRDECKLIALSVVDVTKAAFYICSPDIK